MRHLGIIAAVGLAAAVATGWAVHRQDGAATAFSRRRLAFLETENRRLADTLAARVRADADAAGRSQRSEIEGAIARLRELSFNDPVTYREIGRERLPALLKQKMLQQVPEREFADTGVALAAFGLIPPGMDLQQTYLALLGEQIGAFYDQHAHELFTFSEHPLSNAQNRVVLAHELTHALQDQHFNLLRLPLETKGNDDRAIAASALVEGDATLAMNQYMLGDLTAAALQDNLAGALATDVRQLAAAPKYLRETLLFPYLHGLNFCQTLFEEGGWAALDAAYANPPASTAQILHPEKYLAGAREDPAPVDFGDPEIDGQKPIVDNVLGEFGARQYFLAWLHDEPRAARVAAGWRGDRYLVYGDARASSLIWRVTCASDEAAAAWAAALTASLQARYGKAPARTWSALASGPREVTLIDAADAAWGAKLARKFSHP